VLVHGGTSVSWGKTEIHGHSVPPPKRSGGFVVWLAVAGLAVLLIGGTSAAGAVYYVKHKAAAAQGDMPLPQDRRNLPPLSGSATVTTGATAAGGGGAVNPMPDDRVSLTQPAVTNVPAGAAPSQSASPSGPGVVTTTGVAANGGKRPGKAPTQPKPGAGVAPNAGGGGGDVLPDARK
jgi:hypothetical protein